MRFNKNGHRLSDEFKQPDPRESSTPRTKSWASTELLNSNGVTTHSISLRHTDFDYDRNVIILLQCQVN